jgi:cysteine-rich repeat protein
MKHAILLLFIGSCLFAGCNTQVKASDSCGDNFLDPGEECDGSDLGGHDCLSVGGYDPDAQLTCNADCTLHRAACGSFCGDGTVNIEQGEACDNDNLNGQSCQSLNFHGGALACHNASCEFDTSACTVVCGNGSVESGEPCDDGNQTDGDGCHADCTIEEGFLCDGSSPSICTPVCGDLEVVGDETCDGENLDDETCLTLGWHGGELSCGEDCRLIIDDCEASGRCGDDVVQPDFEDCDGEELFGNTCASNGHTAGVISCADDCTLDLTACTTCGDGVIEGGEQCEGTNFGTATCQNLGFTGGSLACDAACQRVTTGCYNSSCGNGVIDTGEDCEPGTPANLNGKTCVTQGFVSGTLTCNSNCTFNLSNCSMCGNNTVDAGEDCDGTDLGGQSCASMGYTAGSLTCNGNCSLNTLACTTCGNAIIENGEQCEGLNLNGQSCSTQGFFTGDLACAGTCLFNTTGCTNCGNGVINTGEQCDSGNLGGADCTDAGYPGGTVGCNNTTCTFSTTNCWRYTRVASGLSHSCAVRSDGSVVCWGRTNYGQLGNNTAVDSRIPVQVYNLTNAADVFVGDLHSCAITSTGALSCWGRNTYGQLGNGGTTNSQVPVQVVSTSVSRGDGGANHTCIVKTNGSVWCWGYNFYGQLGDGTFTIRSTPTQVLASGGLQVTAGVSHTCLIKTSGGAWCWGRNDYGQLGDNTTTNRSTPTQVYQVTTGGAFIAAGGSHTCLIISTLGQTSLHCWGRNNYGQLGNAGTTDAKKPTQVSLIGRELTNLTAGSFHTCAKRTSYGVYCWGLNDQGQLGIGSTLNKNTPNLISSTSPYTLLSAGGAHSCGINGNYVFCWGDNEYGQLGNNKTQDSTSPIRIY